MVPALSVGNLASPLHLQLISNLCQSRTSIKCGKPRIRSPITTDKQFVSVVPVSNVADLTSGPHWQLITNLFQSRTRIKCGKPRISSAFGTNKQFVSSSYQY